MAIVVKRAYGEDGPVGWDLFIDGEWGNRYPTRAMAREAAAMLY